MILSCGKARQAMLWYTLFRGKGEMPRDVPSYSAHQIVSIREQYRGITSVCYECDDLRNGQAERLISVD